MACEPCPTDAAAAAAAAAATPKPPPASLGFRALAGRTPLFSFIAPAPDLFPPGRLPLLLPIGFAAARASFRRCARLGASPSSSTRIDTCAVLVCSDSCADYVFRLPPTSSVRPVARSRNRAASVRCPRFGIVFRRSCHTNAPVADRPHSAMTMTTVAVVKDYVCGCVDGNFFFFL